MAGKAPGASPAPALEPPAACPAPLLVPSWECRGAVLHKDVALDQRDKGAAGAPSFSLCVRVRASRREEGAAACQIFAKGSLPQAGWSFAAPGTHGVVSFQAGERQREEAPEEPAEVEEQEVAADAEPAEPPPERGEFDVGTTRIDDGEWHHIAVAFECAKPSAGPAFGKLRVWVDGRPDGEVMLVVGASPGARLAVGLSAGESGDDAAEMPEVKDAQVYAHALNDDQVVDLFQRRRQLPTGVTLPLLPAEVSEIWDQPQGSPEARQAVNQALGLGITPGRDFQDDVVCDFFMRLIDFARTICFTSRKTAVAAAIMNDIFAMMHKRSTTTECVGDPCTVSECFFEYRRLILAHANTAGGANLGRLGVFSVPEVKQLTDFVSGALFSHFVLYQCVLVRPQATITQHREVTLERPLPPMDLSVAKQVPKGQLKAALSWPRKPSNAHAGGAAAGVSGAAAGATAGDAAGLAASGAATGEGGFPAAAGGAAAGDDLGAGLDGAGAGGSELASDDDEEDEYEDLPGDEIDVVVRSETRKADRKLRGQIRQHDRTLQQT